MKRRLEVDYGREALLEQVQAYVKHGFRVIPMFRSAGGTCDCARGATCKTPGKHPLVRDWVRTATSDLNTALRWFARGPMRNVGLATGGLGGLLVVDVDARHGGKAAWHNLVRNFGGHPSTVVAKTGGAGWHVFFKTDRPVASSASKVGSGIDIRADGGCVVVAPSVHASGQAYEWVPRRAPHELPLAEAPAWLYGCISSARAAPFAARGVPRGGRDEYILHAGSRNNGLTSVAGRLRRDGGDLESLTSELLRANLERCRPPLDEREVTQIARSICGRYPRGG